MVTLQINQRGAWRTVATFEAVRSTQVVAAVTQLHKALGSQAGWALLHPSDDHPQGRREVLELEVGDGQ